MSRVIATLLGLVLTAGYVSLGQAQDRPCFSPESKPLVEVIQQAPPPHSDNDVYKYYPATAFTSMQLESLNTSMTSRSLYYVQWANHGPRRVKKSNVGPNINPGSGTVELFSTIEKADACTMAQTAASFGDEANSSSFAKGQVEIRKSVAPGEFMDVCFVQSRALNSKIGGIWLDYEVGDWRTADHTASFLLSFAEYVHRRGKKAILYPDPLNAPSQPSTGLNKENIGRIVDAFDLTGIMLWARNREQDIVLSFENQKNLVRPWQPNKIFITYELNHTSIDDARSVESLMKANDIRTLSFWRDLAKQGGSCDLPVNRKIACLATGRCGG